MKRRQFLALVTLTLVTTVSVPQTQGIAATSSEAEAPQTVVSAQPDTTQKVEEPVSQNTETSKSVEVPTDSKKEGSKATNSSSTADVENVSKSVETPTTSKEKISKSTNDSTEPEKKNNSNQVETSTTTKEKVSEATNDSTEPEEKNISNKVEAPTTTKEKVSEATNDSTKSEKDNTSESSDTSTTSEKKDISVQNSDNNKNSIILHSADKSNNNSDSKSTKKYVDAAGNELSEEEVKKVNKLLDSIKNTEGYAIYADELDRTNHIEGNIYVNKASSNTNIVISRIGELDDLDKSHIGESESGIQIQGNSKNVTIEVGPKMNVEKPNQNQTIINGGYSNNITVNQMTEEEAKDAAKIVKKNLDEISKAGEEAKSEIDEVFYADGKDAFDGVGSLMENNIVSKGDVISINVDYKQIINNEGAFGNLINANNGTKVIINVIITDENVTDINIYKGFTAGTKVSTDFNKYSSYVVWNFGDYNGNLNINEEMLGIIVAPKGHVYQAAGNLNGQIIANIAGNNGEVHQVTRKDEEKEKPEETPTTEAEKPEETPTTEAEKPEETPTTESEKPEETPTTEAEKPEETSTTESKKSEKTSTTESKKSEKTSTTESKKSEKNLAHAPKTKKSNAAKTGDSADILNMLLLLGSSGTIIVDSIFKRRKK